jgi:hypothetical protein
MASYTLHVVRAFEERDGGIVPVEPEACSCAGSAPALAARLAQTHVGVIAWSRKCDPELGDWVRQKSWCRPASFPRISKPAGGVGIARRVIR